MYLMDLFNRCQMTYLTCVMLSWISSVSAIDRFIGSRDPSIDFQPIVFKLDFLQRIAVNLDVDDVVTELVGLAYSMLVEMDQKNYVNCAYQAPLNSSGKRGRPSYEITEEQLLFYLSKVSKWVI